MLLNEPTPHTVLTITDDSDAPASAHAETTRLDVIGVAAALGASGDGSSDSGDSAADAEAETTRLDVNGVAAALGASGGGSSDPSGSAAEGGSGDRSSPPDSGELASSADAETAMSGEAGPTDSAAGDVAGGGSDSAALSASAQAGSAESEASPEPPAADSATGPPITDSPTVSFRRRSTAVALPETVAEVVAVVDAASRAIAAAEDAARLVAAAHEREALRRRTPPPVLDLREPAQPAPVDGVLDLLAPVLERPLLVVEQPELPSAPDLMALHRAEFELDFTEPPVVPAGDEPPIPVRFGPGLAVLPHIEFPV